MRAQLKDWLGKISLSQAQWIGIRSLSETAQFRAVRDGKPLENQTTKSAGVMIEVLVNGQFGYAATQHLTLAALQAAAESAFLQAQVASKYAAFKFSESVRPPSVGEYRSPYEKDYGSQSAGELVSLLTRLSTAARVSDKIVKSDSYLMLSEVEMNFVSTNGADISQHFLHSYLDLNTVGQDGSVTQTRSMGGMQQSSMQCGLEFLQEDLLLENAKRVGEQTLELLGAEDCPEATTHLVLAPDQMMLQIHESIGHPLELDRILGDERNYAGSSFIQLSDFGSLQYGSPLLNVTFDPTVKGQFASYSFDDTGAPAHREYLIKDGLLLRGLGSLESQARSGVPGVANARVDSWKRPPIDRMANLNIEPGTSSFEDMISSIENGVYMETNRSWSIDDYRNKFQFGCEYAKRIENGKLTKTLRNPNYRGITSSFWKKLTQVGRSDTFKIFGTPYCGKGEPNQVIRVGHASPVCVFSDVEVFGGAK